jgi:hypothetical protein
MKYQAGPDCICLQDECPAIKTGNCHYQSLYPVKAAVKPYIPCSAAAQHLFDAAPDMLEALKRIRNSVDSCNCVHVDDYVCPYCIADLAIRKAEK